MSEQLEHLKAIERGMRIMADRRQYARGTGMDAVERYHYNRIARMITDIEAQEVQFNQLMNDLYLEGLDGCAELGTLSGSQASNYIVTGHIIREDK